MQTALAFLIGTKYDEFHLMSDEEKEEITRQVRAVTARGEETPSKPHRPVALRECATRCPRQARKFAKAMKAPLIFCSAAESINVQKIFKIVLSKAFDLKCTIPMQTEIGAPILEY